MTVIWGEPGAVTVVVPSSGRPVVSRLAEEFYLRLEPVAGADESLGWPLLRYVSALVAPLEEVEEVVRDDLERDLTGWAVALDPENAPAAVLPWLAQFDGTVLTPGSSEVQQRAAIVAPGGFLRGTPAAIQAHVARTLTGNRTVVLVERVSSEATLQVVTYGDETPDPTRTEAFVRAAVPAGIVVDYVLADGQTWGQVNADHGTWADLDTAFDTWADVRTATPA